MAVKHHHFSLDLWKVEDMKELMVKHYLTLEPVGGRGGCEGAEVKHYTLSWNL